MAPNTQPAMANHPLITVPSRISTYDARTLFYERSEAGMAAWIRTSLDIRFGGANIPSAELHDELCRRHDGFIKYALAMMNHATFQGGLLQCQQQSFLKGLSPENRAKISQLPPDQIEVAISRMIRQAEERQNQASGEQDRMQQDEEPAQDEHAKKKRRLDVEGPSQD
ncbi:hypothetical protein AC578_9191 [Pseudocercospora eumusae]|uniref:Uncharacterized protein n=1 Tax=Pseudocercospora eumusae TaxID=321146 RepID=A0A139HV34_9PEZI|nr:hypothetical protein AC578_9191 [Pseudocercospora eumusae]